MLRTKVVEKIKTGVYVQYFSENPSVCKIMWKNAVDPDTPQMTIWLTRIACWIPKATDTYSQYVILIAARLMIPHVL